MSSNKDKEPCIYYESKVNAAKMEVVKLTQEYTNRSDKKKTCPVATGEGGIEEILFVEQRFRKIARKLDYDDGEELFDNFEEVLTDTAEEKWGNVVDDIDEADRTPERFEEAIKEFYLRFVEDGARDDMFNYLESSRVCKPPDIDVQTHANRIEQLIHYANKLPGLNPPKNDDQIKLMVLRSFPDKWQVSYSRSAKNLSTDTLSGIVDYMANEKGIADKNTKSTRKRKAEEIEADDASNETNKCKQKDVSFELSNGKNTCRHHGSHDWKNCYLNRYSKNYNPEAAQKYYDKLRNGGREQNINSSNRNDGGYRARGGGYRGYGHNNNNNNHTNNHNNSQNQRNTNEQYSFNQRNANEQKNYTTGFKDAVVQAIENYHAQASNESQPSDSHYYDYIGGNAYAGPYPNRY